MNTISTNTLCVTVGRIVFLFILTCRWSHKWPKHVAGYLVIKLHQYVTVHLPVLKLYSGKTEFLGSFAKLREAPISFVTSVRLAVRMEERGSHQTDFQEIL
jgi:hypothetical protein